MGRWPVRGSWLVVGVGLGCTGTPEAELPADGGTGSSSGTMAPEASTIGTGPAGGTTFGGTGPGADTGSTGAEGVSTTAADDSPVVFDLGTPDMPGAGRTCSGDLKRVLDGETGAVIEICPPNQGCLGGQCVPACIAAAGSEGSIGCEFIVPTSPFFSNGNPGSLLSGPCHALFVANSWDQPAELQLTRDGMVYDVDAVTRIPSGITTSTVYDPLPVSGVPPGQVAVMFLSHRPGVGTGTSLECPLTPAVLDDTAAHGTSSGMAFELSSDTPIQVYDIIPYGGASSYLPSASLLHPSTAWGSSYLLNSPHLPTGTKWMTVVGAVDGTTVSVQPSASILPGSILAPPLGMATDYVLDRGQTLQWSSDGDLVASIVTADQPIGMLTGNTYLLVNTADAPLSGQDSAHQMIPAVNALGSEYVGGGLVTRLVGGMNESVLYRIVGVVGGTHLDWDPAPPFGAPVTLQAGENYEFQSREPFSVRSQDDMHPFSLSQYMSGSLQGVGCGTDPAGVCPLGDDEWVTLVPPQQYLRYYPFFVDPTYGTSTLVVVRTRSGGIFEDVELSCMGPIVGWQPVGGDGRFEVAHVDLFRGSVPSVPGCDTSQHLATSDAPFGVMVWGVDSFSSYGYPAGGNLQTINEVDIDPAG